MASLGEINILIGLKGADKVVSDFEGINKSLKKFSTELGGFSRDLGQIGRSVQRTGTLISGAFSAAFIAARKDVPAVGEELKKLKDNFLSISDSIAKATLPSLQEFTKVMGGVSNVFKFLAENNSPLLNTILKFSAFAVVIGTVIVALANLLKGIASVASALRRFAFSVLPFVVANIIPITIALAALGAVFLLFRKQIEDFLKQIKKAFEDGLEKPAERALNSFEQFGAGFRENLRKLGENARIFGDQVRQSLENAFSDTLFDAITGRLKGLRSIITALGEDILRAFTRLIANSALEKLTSSLGGIFGFGKGKDDINDKERKAKERLNAETDKLTKNFQRLAIAKDAVIAKFRQFTGMGSSGPGGGGAIAGPMGAVAAVSPEAIGSAQSLSDVFKGMGANVQTVNAAIAGIGGAITAVFTQMVTSFAVANTIMLGLSAAFGFAALAIVGSIAAALTALWAPAALFASIATFGAAAGIGSAALAAAAGSVGASIGIAGGAAKAASGSLTIAPGALQSGNFGGEGIPQLAEGGIVTKPTLAMIGEAGPEAVVPLDGSAGMGGVNITLGGPVFMDNPGDVDRLVRKLADGFIRMTRRTTGGTAIAF